MLSVCECNSKKKGLGEQQRERGGGAGSSQRHFLTLFSATISALVSGGTYYIIIDIDIDGMPKASAKKKLFAFLVFVCVLMQLIIYYCLFISPHNN